jgi:hypothetical protein
MNILDENVLEGQRRLLENWRIPFRQIGYEIGRKGMSDDEIIPFLLHVRQATFFTIDHHFYNPRLRHRCYSLVYLDVNQAEAASFVRRLLRHPELDTQAKRMGAVIRVSHLGISVFSLHSQRELRFPWTD